MAALLRRLAIAAVGGAVVCLIAAGCQPEPSPTASASPTPTPTISVGPPSPTPIETEKPQVETLPAACEDVYSAAMLASLNQQIPPLNDPGVTMLSTQNVDLIELLDSGIPTLRCSWGGPSEYGMATNISLIDAGQSSSVLATLGSSGFACEEYADGYLCSIAEGGVDFDDQQYEFGEIHYVTEDVWVATSWLNFRPEGVTEDIVQHLWG